MVWLVRHLLSECGSSFGPGFAPPPATFAATAADGGAVDVTLPAAVAPPSSFASMSPSPTSPSSPSSSSAPRPLSVEDIGVIAPYRRQVVALRGALRAAGLGGVGVGTVLNYQGQEKRVVVLSTVLSGTYGRELARKAALAARAAAAPFPAPPAADASPPPPPVAPAPLRPPAAGLLHDPQTFNVAVTRAQSLLLAVGDPAVWSADPAWRTLLQHAVDNGGYLGWAGAACPLAPSAASLWSPSPAKEEPAAAAVDATAASISSGGMGTQTPPRVAPRHAVPAAGVIGRSPPTRASPTPGDAAAPGGVSDGGGGDLLSLLGERLSLALRFGEQEGVGRLLL